MLLTTFILLNSALATTEATGKNYWQEFDIVFWQTAPFAIFWGNLLDQQVAASLAISGFPHWQMILGFAAVVSVTNAAYHAHRATTLE